MDYFFSISVEIGIKSYISGSPRLNMSAGVLPEKGITSSNCKKVEHLPLWDSQGILFCNSSVVLD